MARLEGDRGSAATEAVLITPVLLFLILVVIQFGLWYHAQHVAQAAAQEGVRTARAEGSTAQAGQDRASAFLGTAGPSIITSPVVTSQRDADTASVTVDGDAVNVLPGFSLRVHASSTSPVERFREDTDGEP